MKNSKSLKKTKRAKRDLLDQDLSKMIQRSEMIPASALFDYLPKDATISLRLPGELLKAVKQRAHEERKDLQKLIREALIGIVTKKAS